MMKHTQHTIKTPHRAIVGLLCAFILLFGLSLVFLPKTALAGWFDYYDVKSFSGDVADNSAILTIQVKTSFSIPYRKRPAQYFCFSYKDYNNNANLFTIRDTETGDWSAVIDPFSVKENGVLKYGSWDCPASVVFLAGYTYDFKLTKNRATDGSNLLGSWMRTYYDSMGKGWFYLNIGDYINKLFENSNLPDLYNYNIYDFLPVPLVQITFPPQNSEIAEAFYIQGTYDAKDLGAYPNLYIWLQYQNNDIYPFVKNFETITGDLNERISGLPAGDYQIRFIFAGGTGYFEVPDKISIKVVETIPYELPETQETTPEFFGVVKGDEFYPLHSNYPTPTNLYSNLINAVQPVIIVVGDNLTFFSSKFDQATAKETGTKTAQAILLVRSYSSNLNTFFNDLPISEFLLFYLTLLIVVIVFRIIKNLINLIKP